MKVLIVGVDDGTPVTEDYRTGPDSRFAGKINQVTNMVSMRHAREWTSNLLLHHRLTVAAYRWTATFFLVGFFASGCATPVGVKRVDQERHIAP